MNKKAVVYVAGPISKGSLIHNVKQAHDAGVALLKAGFSVIVPHGSCFWGNMVTPSGCFIPEASTESITHDQWLEMDLELVRRSDALLRLPGESAGADREVKEAKLRGIPVYHNLHLLIESELARKYAIPLTLTLEMK